MHNHILLCGLYSCSRENSLDLSNITGSLSLCECIEQQCFVRNRLVGKIQYSLSFHWNGSVLSLTETFLGFLSPIIYIILLNFVKTPFNRSARWLTGRALWNKDLVQSHVSHNISLNKFRSIYMLLFQDSLANFANVFDLYWHCKERTECHHKVSSRPRAVFFCSGVVAGLVEVHTVDIIPLLCCLLVGFLIKSGHNYENIYTYLGEFL